jgi:hypothetical protein
MLETLIPAWLVASPLLIASSQRCPTHVRKHNPQEDSSYLCCHCEADECQHGKAAVLNLLHLELLQRAGGEDGKARVANLQDDDMMQRGNSVNSTRTLRRENHYGSNRTL